MADQVEIYLPRTRINERSQVIATARFRTIADAAASTPTTVHYKLSDLTSEEVIRDWTSVSAAAEVSVTLTAADNKINDNSKPMQRMELLVVADKGLATESVGRKSYQVRNVYGRRD